MTQLNGDDVVAAVYLNRSGIRGCIASNRHSLDDNKNFRLSIEKEKPNDVFWIKICHSVDGSMGSSCNKLIIQFVKRNYLLPRLPRGNKDVVSIEKLGEWRTPSTETYAFDTNWGLLTVHSYDGVTFKGTYGKKRWESVWRI